MARSPPFAGGLLLLLLLSAATFVPLRLLAAQRHFEGFEDASDVVDDDDPFDSQPSIPSPSLSLSVSSPEAPSDPITPPPPSPIDASELWDEDEFEGIPITNPISSPADLDPVPVQDPSLLPADSPKPSSRPLRSYTIEIVCISFLIAFTLNYFIGRRENELIALAWASKFATKDSIFDKNFSLLGAGEHKDAPLLLKEARDVFKFWASGRRCCKGLIATLELKSRHDLISRMWEMVFMKKDTITFEVMMNDDAMDHVVLAVARRKASKAMQKETRDLQRFTSVLAWAPAGRKWVSEELAIVAESKEVTGDLITDVVLDQVFGEKAFEKFGKGFISLHFSDQYPGSHSKMLIFKFALPDAKNMADMTRLVALVPYYIDLIGHYKLSSQARSKTDAARSKAAQEAYKELQNARREALQKRKEEKRRFIDEAEAKFTVEAISKREEKERVRQSKKSKPRIKMMRSH
ncbi:hypothetical protein J5N97_012378 [Dioscorea zingiberensis]|uniref:Coiled-coil domain-containing protein 47 n=1 Tax=Dioscorea zingiberensis TaxID=325984 RepID=A0A9D5CPM5_9LILI|nr:hypothetical protein J5N97_012378 [Dioscorea zingiberensis]